MNGKNVFDVRMQNMARRNRTKRLLKRAIALLSAIVLLFTMNTLKHRADTLERIPMCGLEEHVHTSACYSEGGELVCPIPEHQHTDACYQQRPVHEDALDGTAVDDEVDDQDELSLALTPEEPTEVETEEAPAEAVEAPEADKYSYSMKDQDSVRLSQVLQAAKVPVKMSQITMVGLVEGETAESPRDLLAIQPEASDFTFVPLKDFDRVEVAIVTDSDIVTFALTDGVAPVIEETPVEEAPAETEEAPAEAEEQTEVGNDAAKTDEVSEEKTEEPEAAGAPAGEDEAEEQPSEEKAEPEVEATEEKAEEEKTEEEPSEEAEEEKTEEEPSEKTEEEKTEEEPSEKTEEEETEEEPSEKTEEENTEEEPSEKTEEENTEEEPSEETEEEKTEEEPSEKAEEEKTEEEPSEKAEEEKTEEEPSEKAEEEATEEEPSEKTEEEATEEENTEEESSEENEETEQPAEDEVSEPAEETAEETAAQYAATLDLSEIEEYPLSLRALLAGVEALLPEAESAAPAAPAAPAEAEEPAEAEAPAEPAELPAAEWKIEYDGNLLSVEAAEDDYHITPVAPFEETRILVDNGARYALTLTNYAQAEAEPEPAEEPAWPAQEFEGHAAGMKVSVTAGEGAFPEGTTMVVCPVEDEATLDGIAGTVQDDFVDVKRVHAVDITFYNAEGEEIEPLLPISVVMTVEELEQNQEAVVVHVDNEGGAEVVDASDATDMVETAPAEQAVAFESDAFSVYALVVTETIETRYIAADGATWNISVGFGPESGIPANAELDVRELTGEASEMCLNEAAEALRGVESITLARFFDITILVDGQPIQPAAPVEVRVTLADGTDDAVKAVHFDHTGEMELVDADREDEAVTFNAESFSVYGVVYTVDFHWTANGQTFDYGIPGGDCASLRDLLPALEIVRDDPETELDELEEFLNAIDTVTFSSPDLLAVYKVEETAAVGALRAALGVESEYSAALTDEDRAAIDARVLTAPDWALFSLKPFNTNEALTVAMTNGDTFTIAVTDAQIAARVLAADGNAYIITLTFGPEAGIPLDAELNVTEIEQGTEYYQQYITDSVEALGILSADNITFARFFDIEILKDGEKIEPAAPVQVTVAYEDALSLGIDDTLSVVHFAESDTDVEPEIITDITLNDAGTEINYQQSSFSVTGTIVTNPQVSTDLQPEHPYALVIHHTDGKYYVVENDGTLTLLNDSDIVFDGNGQVQSVKMINPIFWTYQQTNWNGNYTLWHNTLAREFDPGTGLAKAYIRRYLSADVDAGYADINDNIVPTDLDDRGRCPEDGRYVNIQYNGSTHHINHYGRYIGVVQAADGTLRISGNRSYNQAAEIYLAEAMSVSDVNIRNHTVNHIDISVEAKATIKLPLAYGSYALAELDNNGNMTGNYRSEPLVVSRENEVTLEVEEKVPIESADIKKADITAYTIVNGTRQPKNDVYEVTGYSQNAEAQNDTPQIRLEGSFKVADLDPIPRYVNGRYVDENDSWWCGQRLQNRIYYDVSLSKPVTFRMVYKDQTTGKKYVVMKEGQPFDVTANVTLSTSFNFWDPANTCPGCVLIFNRDTWLTGVIPNNSEWNQQNHLDGGPGMDFRLGASKDASHTVVAIEVTKYVQGDDGTVVQTLQLHDPLDCLVNVYQNNTWLHNKVVSVGTDGMGMIYDYDVTAGTYDNPAHAKIAEVADSVDDEVIDAQGQRWVYDRSRMETEWVWRDYSHPKRHISQNYNKQSAGGLFYSDEEVLGEYKNTNGGNEFNRFLEFYVYNIYTPKTYPVSVKKVDASNNDGISGAKFDLYGPYAEEDTLDTTDSSKKLNTAPITTDASTISLAGNLASGIYYLVETQTPTGYRGLAGPVKITVDSRQEGTQGEVKYRLSTDTADVAVSFEDDAYTLTIPNEPLGNLELSKTVQAAPGASLPQGYENQSFTFTVALTAPDYTALPATVPVKIVNASNNSVVTAETDTSITSTVTENGKTTRGTISITLKHGQKAIIRDLPAGTTYSITETTPAEYSLSWVSGKGESGTIPHIASGNAVAEAQAINTYTVVNVTKAWYKADANGTVGAPTNGSVTLNLYQGTGSDGTVALANAAEATTAYCRVVLNGKVDVAENPGTDQETYQTAGNTADAYEDSPWHATFIHLPAYDANGLCCAYVVKEAELTGYDVKYSEDGTASYVQNGGTITNTQKPMIAAPAATKVFKDLRKTETDQSAAATLWPENGFEFVLAGPFVATVDPESGAVTSDYHTAHADAAEVTMPQGDNLKVYPSYAEPKKTFADITFRKAGTYFFTVTESMPENPVVGIVYDTTPHHVMVVVTEVAGGALNAEVSYPDDGADAGSTVITNTYDEVSQHPETGKTLTGRAWKAGDSFTFTMAAKTDDHTDGTDDGPSTAEAVQAGKVILPSPVTAEVTAVETPEGSSGSYAASREAVFGDITFKDVGTYIFEITENRPDDVTEAAVADSSLKTYTKDGVIYSQKKVYAKFVVTRGDQGKLNVADPTYAMAVCDEGVTVAVDATTGELSYAATQQTFTNKYKATGFVDFKAHKTFRNGALTQGKFTFKLTQVGEPTKDAAGELAATAVASTAENYLANGTQTKSNSASDTAKTDVSFDRIVFEKSSTIPEGATETLDQTGDYYFLLEEDVPEVAKNAEDHVDPATGIKYDVSKTWIKVTVEDNETGALTVTKYKYDATANEGEGDWLEVAATASMPDASYTNEQLVFISGQKQWHDEMDENQTRPADVSVTLKLVRMKKTPENESWIEDTEGSEEVVIQVNADGTGYKKYSKTSDVPDGWTLFGVNPGADGYNDAYDAAMTYTWEKLPKSDDNGTEYKYQVIETNCMIGYHRRTGESSTPDHDDVYVQVINNVAFSIASLPSTGGIGTGAYTFGGIALMLLAAALLILRKREA